MNKRPPHPTSTNPTLAELNELIYKTYPPKWMKGGWWGYGKLYYLDDRMSGFRIMGLPEFLEPSWMLDGMTPVGAGCVLEMLEREGQDVSKFAVFFDQIEADRQKAIRARDELRSSAASKLTADERNACGL